MKIEGEGKGLAEDGKGRQNKRKSRDQRGKAEGWGE
jgi:hypothetical protein